MSLPSVPIVDPQARTIGVQFTESMTGFVTATVDDNYEQAYEHGKAAGQSLSFVLTIATQDESALIHDPQHQARAIGTVTAPILARDDLCARQLSAVRRKSGSGGVRNMIYRLPLLTQEGAASLLSGFKVIRDDGLLNLWRDNTTLYTTVHDGPDAGSSVLCAAF